jgi:DNA-binding CsgD family transcriptional regulator
MPLDSHLSQVLELWASDPYISMATIGRKLKISRERVRQLIEKAILKGKTVLSSEEREINRITAKQKSIALMKDSLKLDIPPYAIHTTTILRKRVSALGLFVKCEMCDWNEEPKILVCHHMDRNRKNNAIINLLCVCPNCHAILHLIDKAMITNQNGIRIKGPNAIQNKYKRDHRFAQVQQ